MFLAPEEPDSKLVYSKTYIKLINIVGVIFLKLLSKLCFQSTKCHSPQGVAWDPEPPPPLTTSQSRVLDYHIIALIFKCSRSACFGHTARSNDFSAEQRQNSECCKMEIAWNICRLWINSVRFNNIPCRITSWHAASHVTQENMISLNLSLQYTAKRCLGFQTLTWKLWPTTSKVVTQCWGEQSFNVTLQIKASSSNSFGFLSCSSRVVPVAVTSSIDSRTFTDLQSTNAQTLVSFTASTAQQFE